jgi:hypothetical protein
MTAAEAVVACAVIVVLIFVVCFLVVVPMLHNAKMDPDRDREER